MKIKKIDVIIAKSHSEYFTYKVPDNLNLSIGDFLEISFRNKIVIGIYFRNSNTKIEDCKLKYVIRKINIPSLKKEQIDFILKVAKYTLYSMGDILKMFIPTEIKENKNISYIYSVVDESLANSIKQQKLVEILKNNISSLSFLKDYGFNSSYLEQMIVKGLVSKQIESREFCQIVNLDVKLSNIQQQAVDYILRFVSKDIYKTILLKGVTGSGKTEVYFSVIIDILKNSSKQILILVPEIMLSAQLTDRIKNRFGIAPCVWHSNISTLNRNKAWFDITFGHAKIIVGARSALFLPFKNLELIIVDEEHEPSYKQEDNVIYNARDMAVLRAACENIVVILASATPSLESLYNVKNKNYGYVDLPKRFSNVEMPIVEIIDMKLENLPKNKWISDKLKQLLIENAAEGKQSMLFLNRRGYAPLTICKSCGHKFLCNHCATSLVEHKSKNKLECHHCGYHISKPNFCFECKGDLVACGPGIERIEEEVKLIDDSFKTVTINKDSFKNINEANQFIKDIVDNKYNIIIGTQVIAKGLHFPNLTLVGIIDADIGLVGGDLRASEKQLHLLNQLSGRAGRENIQGKVILQCYNPTDPIIIALSTGEVKKFLQHELKSRKEHFLPPYGKLVSIIISSKIEEKAKNYSKLLVSCAPSSEEIEILGPTAAILSKIKDNYRFRILVKSKLNCNLQKYIRSWFSYIKPKYDVKIKVDVDPYNFF